MAELTPEQQAAGIFLDAAGNLTNPDGTPVADLGMGRGGLPPAGILGAIQQQANPMPPNLGMGEPRLMQAVASLSGKSFLDETGQYAAMGAPNEEGLAPFATQLDGSLAEPSSYGFGPTYGESETAVNRSPIAPTDLDWSGGTPYPNNWQDYTYPSASSAGGYFTADQLFGGGVEGSVIPSAFQNGSNLPSTNNWRMLPPPWNIPGYIMRNGTIIRTNDALVEHPFGMMQISYASGAPDRAPAAIGPGVFAGFNYTAHGWPGSVTPWPAYFHRQG